MMGAAAARRWWLDHPEDAAKLGLSPDGSLFARDDQDGLRTCDQCCYAGCTCPCHRKETAP